MDEPEPGSWMIWIDGVGGIWICFSDQVTLGSSKPAARDYVPLLGDLLPEHAKILRDGDWYLVVPVGPARLNGRPLYDSQVLAPGDRLELGQAVCLEVCYPNPLSHSLRIQPVGSTTTWPRSQAILLIDRWFMLGPRESAHVVVPNWSTEVVLVRQHGGLCLRTPREFVINGRKGTSDTPLQPPCRVTGPGFSFFAEPVG